MSTGMKRKSIFYDILYLEHIKIVDLLDTMHILKNVSSSLWRYISWKKSDTIAVERGLFLPILKRNIGQKWKIEERQVTLGLLKR